MVRPPRARFYSTACRVRAHRAKSSTIPERMRGADRWMRWQAREQGGRIHKVPLTIDGAPASSTNPDTWSTFTQARSSSVGDGLGFALGDGIGCYDLDDCFDSGALKPWALEFLAAIPEPVILTEVSPSGSGVHVFIDAPESPGRVIRDGRKIERYTAARYMTVTGNRFTP